MRKTGALLLAISSALLSSVCFGDMHRTSICEGRLQEFPQFERITKLKNDSVEWHFNRLGVGTYQVTEKPLHDDFENKWRAFTCQVGNLLVLEALDPRDQRFQLAFVNFENDTAVINAVVSYNEEQLNANRISYETAWDGPSRFLIVHNSHSTQDAIINQCILASIDLTFEITEHH